MKRLDLLKPGGSRNLQLNSLAREIIERQDTLELLERKVEDTGSSYVCEAILQGECLIRVKQMVGHGNFMNWVKIHCPTVSHIHCNRYMLIAKNSARVKNMPSLRAALLLCRNETNGNGSTKSWPAYIEALGKAAKFLGYIERHPLQSWPTEGKEKLKGDLLPLAAALWPEKFA